VVVVVVVIMIIFKLYKLISQEDYKKYTKSKTSSEEYMCTSYILNDIVLLLLGFQYFWLALHLIL